MRPISGSFGTVITATPEGRSNLAHAASTASGSTTCSSTSVQMTRSKLAAREVHLVDLALHEPDVVSGEVLASDREILVGDVDRGEARLGEHAEDVSPSRADLGDVEPTYVSDERTDDRQPATLDESDRERRARVVVVDRVLDRQTVIEALDLDAHGTGE